MFMEKKQILSELNRVREIMGLSVLLEQENIDPNIYKEFEGGKPYELFLLKATPTSKLYFESTGEGVKDSQRFKYRRKIRIAGWQFGRATEYRISTCQEPGK